MCGRGPRSEHVHEIKNRNDRDRNANGPGQNAFHGGAPLVVQGLNAGGGGVVPCWEVHALMLGRWAGAWVWW